MILAGCKVRLCEMSRKMEIVLEGGREYQMKLNYEYCKLKYRQVDLKLPLL